MLSRLALLLFPLILCSNGFCQEPTFQASTENAQALIQAGPTPEQTLLLLSSSYSSSPVSSVHIEGIAHSVAGATDETGPFSYDASRSGISSLRLSVGT